MAEACAALEWAGQQHTPHAAVLVVEFKSTGKKERPWASARQGILICTNTSNRCFGSFHFAFCFYLKVLFFQKEKTQRILIKTGKHKCF